MYLNHITQLVKQFLKKSHGANRNRDHLGIVDHHHHEDFKYVSHVSFRKMVLEKKIKSTELQDS